jgi:hypothetical protein
VRVIKLVVVAINMVFIAISTAIFLSLISGTTATASIVSQYAVAVFGFVFLVITIVLAISYAGERSKDSDYVGITTAVGAFCGGLLIVYGIVLAGGLLVMICLASAVIYRIFV